MTRAKNGQIRGNDQGGIVLVSNVGLDVFNVIVLRRTLLRRIFIGIHRAGRE